MKNPMLLMVLALSVCCSPTFALDASGQRYAQMLTSGGPGTTSRAAQDIFNTGASDQELLDIAAQVLSDFYLKNPETRDYADATAWLCKALGNSSNGRYKALLEKVSNAEIGRRTRSHCSKAADNLPAGAASSFQPGSVDLAKYRPGGSGLREGKPAEGKSGERKSAERKTAKSAPASEARSKPVNFSIVKEGMSMEEVNDLLGAPTNQTSYMTGKQFNPFNYGARDVQRTKYLYKGVGHIVFSLKTAYNGVYRVIEIVPDASETGYP